MCAAKFFSSRKLRQHDGRPVAVVCIRSDARGARGGCAPTDAVGRPSCPAWPVPGRISPTRSTPWLGISRRRCATPEVTTAVARGDLSRKITVDVKGEILELKNTINTMVDQLNAFAGEVTRVAREVGTDGKLGGQAEVPDVAGTWKDLTDNVNFMASNLTGQVAAISPKWLRPSPAATCFAEDRQDVRGEISAARWKLSTPWSISWNRFAGEATRVAREAGTEGRIRRQANVPGVAGTWKDLTDSVNTDTGNLTISTGAQHRRGDHGRGRGDLSRKNYGRREGRNPRNRRTRSTPWSTSSNAPCGRGDARGLVKWAPEGKLGG